MPVHEGEATWDGLLKEGRGAVQFAGSTSRWPFSFRSRFEESHDTSPEAFVGAALAGCYAMALSAELGKAGYKPGRIRASAGVHVEREGASFAVTRIELAAMAEAKDTPADEFQQIAAKAKDGCAIGKALSAVPIELDARLVD